MSGRLRLCSFISAFRAERLARNAGVQGEFIEIFVEAPIETVVGRDPSVEVLTAHTVEDAAISA